MRTLPSLYKTKKLKSEEDLSAGQHDASPLASKEEDAAKGEGGVSAPPLDHDLRVRKTHLLPATKNGMSIPELWSIVICLIGPFVRSLEPPKTVSRSLVRENPVVTIRSSDPSQHTRELLTPVCESATVTALAPLRGSNNRNFLSLQVVA